MEKKEPQLPAALFLSLKRVLSFFDDGINRAYFYTGAIVNAFCRVNLKMFFTH